MNGTSVVDEKQRIRREMKDARASLADRAERSLIVMDHVRRIEAYQLAKVILFYVDVRDEVQTRSLLEQELASAKVIAVPYCVDGELKLVKIRTLQELDVGAYGILEPSNQLRQDNSRTIQPGEVDVALIPGVAFDSRGARLGHGKGYYDKLLCQFRVDTVTIGVAFECQLFENLPTESHDVRVHLVITETGARCVRGPE